MKRLLIVAASIVALGVAWYLLSPLWRPIEREEPSPLAPSSSAEPAIAEPAVRAEQDSAMPAERQAAFEQAMARTREQVMEKAEPMPTRPRVIAQGVFRPRAHDVKGSALLIERNQKRIVRFENFETVNGPDVRIYLSADLQAKDYVELGKIRATRGSANYDVPSGTDTSKYNKVLVWCEDFAVLFSYAELQGLAASR